LAILAHVTWPRAQPLNQSITLKFPYETRLESKSFEPLMDFLAFLVQTLWSKINKEINYLIRELSIVLFTLDHKVSMRNPSKSSKVSKDSDCSIVSNKNSAKYYHLTV